MNIDTSFEKESQVITREVLMFCSCANESLGLFGKQKDGRKRQGQRDLCSYCGDERSYHFGCFDNGDFSLLGSISFSLRLYQGNYPA